MNKIASHYQGAKGREYCQIQGQGELSHLGYKLQARFFRPHLRPDDLVLDFGCGNGSMSRELRRGVREIQGLEVNASARELARSQGLTVFGDLQELPRSAKYSAIVSNHVLEHVPNVIETLALLRAHLEGEGRLVLMLPIDDFREKTNRTWRAEDPNHHLHTWTPLLLGNTLQEAGFTPRELSIVTHAWTPKLFFLGDTLLQAVACRLLAVVRRRRQLFALATGRL
jgi:2-polyprenyl-3-methyl-5-hydroxy-6-metoxy-1,4-benzoquinol methylase